MSTSQIENGVRNDAKPVEQLFQMATGHMATTCTWIAAELHIADLIGNTVKPVAELARAARVNEDALYRILRALSSGGIFTEAEPRAFANTPASELMRSDAEGSIRDLVVWMSSPLHLRVFAEAMHAVRTGENAFKKATGLEAFDYFEKHPDTAEVFNTAMTNLSAMVVPAALEAYDFSGLGTLADIAGGHGMVLTSILSKHGDLRGILFDLPHVVPGAKARVESLGLTSRCDVTSGDFFKAVPAADNYIMKHIIHDWDDAQAIQILKNCAAAMRGKGKVILLESVIKPGNEPAFGKWVDLEMLFLPGGRERTEQEFGALFSQSGLRLSRIVETKSPLSIVEAVKL
jgi:hypothetical protein